MFAEARRTVGMMAMRLARGGLALAHDLQNAADVRTASIWMTEVRDILHA